MHGSARQSEEDHRPSPAPASCRTLHARGRRTDSPRALWKIDVEGLHRLPPTGGAILCPNHISFLDSAFLMLAVPRRISFVGKAEYMDSWKTKFLFPAMGHDPDRSVRRARRVTPRSKLHRRRSARGQLFGIFPEGTRSRDGHLHKGHTGAARLALTTGCPIIPVGVVGTADDPASRRQDAQGGRRPADPHRAADRRRSLQGP